MQRLQTAVLQLLDAEDAQSGCRRAQVQLVNAQYSIVQAWVERGKQQKSLGAVEISSLVVLDKASTLPEG